MGKKHKPEAQVPVAGAAPLKHSPFASLGGGAAVSPPTAAATDPVPVAEEIPRGGRLVLRRETKHRGGKAVVIISGFDAIAHFDQAAIAALAKACKEALACGGTSDGNEIVLQGDRPAEVAELLRARGFRVAGVTS